MEVENVKPKKFLPEDINKFYLDIIGTWKPPSEAWPFKHGDDLTTGCASLTGFYLTHFFRKELKLRGYAKLTCYLPIVGLASIGCYIASSFYVTSAILAKDTCPLCITVKSSLLQLATGFVYPLMFTPIVTFFMADRLLTYPVPSLQHAPKEVFYLWLKLIRKNPRPLFIAAGAQALVAGLIAQQKMSFVYRNFP